MQFKERRQAQRVEANLAVTIKGGPAEAKGRALNISTNGIYFESPQYIEPLTKVRLELVVPEAGASKRGVAVSCDGVVVRTEPERLDPAVATYNVAIFFTFVPDASQKTLDRYIRARLAS
jgi:c-di-GMP-binding flagellar brake protein YcgR